VNADPWADHPGVELHRAHVLTAQAGYSIPAQQWCLVLTLIQ
jgi:hypothetical protein